MEETQTVGLLPCEVNFEAIWEAELKPLLLKLEQGETIRGLQIYRLIYKLCVATPKPHTEILYQKIAAILIDKVCFYRANLLKVPQEDVLRTYSSMWRGYTQFTFRLNGICIYMNKVIQSIHCNQPDFMIVGTQGDRIHLRFETIEVLALSIWRKAMLKHFENHSVKRNIITEAILDAAKITRQLQFQVPDSDTADLKAVVEPYLHYEFYMNFVEAPILNMASDIYSSIAIGHDFNEFIKTLETIESNEIAWATLVFAPSTVEALKRQLQQVLILKNLAYIEENIDYCLESFEYQANRRLYLLLTTLPGGVEKIALGFERVFSLIGLNILAANDDMKPNHSDWLAILLSTFRQFDLNMNALITTSFQSDKSLSLAYQRVMESIVNSPKFSFGLLLSKSFDSIINSESNGDGSDQFKSQITYLTKFVAFLLESDSFFKDYVKQLAERLLFSKQADLYAEELILDAFKKVLHNDHVNKINQMILDKKNSMAISNEFDSFVREHQKLIAWDHDISVLTAHHWPPSSLVQPDAISSFPEMMQFCSAFESYYGEFHPKKRLEWMHQLSRVHLILNASNGKPYDLFVSFAQFQVLMIFQDRKSATLSEISKLLGYPIRDLYKAVKPLVLIDLLQWSRSVKKFVDVDENISLIFNESFTHTKAKLRMAPEWPSPSSSNVDAERYDQESIDGYDLIETQFTEENKFQLQALIIRLLKVRKNSSKAHLLQLINESWPRDRPKAQVDLITPILDSLVNREFLEFDPNTSIYTYVA